MRLTSKVQSPKNICTFCPPVLRQFPQQERLHVMWALIYALSSQACKIERAQVIAADHGGKQFFLEDKTWRPYSKSYFTTQESMRRKSTWSYFKMRCKEWEIREEQLNDVVDNNHQENGRKTCLSATDPTLRFFGKCNARHGDNVIGIKLVWCKEVYSITSQSGKTAASLWFVQE